MVTTHRLFAVLFTLTMASISGAMAAGAQPPEPTPVLEQGRRLYERACVWCHGAAGRGDGPASWHLGRFSAPRPRDLTRESFKFRSTPSGTLPSDQDLFRTITHGIPGVMPSFHALSEEARWNLVEYVKQFNPSFTKEPRAPLIMPPPPPTPTESTIANGRNIYRHFGCHVCHGDHGQGNGPESINGNLRDARQLPIQATDLTARTQLKNGGRPEDLYRSIMTGLDGTPMPSYADQFQGQESDAWDLVWYLQSLAEGRRQ